MQQITVRQFSKGGNFVGRQFLIRWFGRVGDLVDRQFSKVGDWSLGDFDEVNSH